MEPALEVHYVEPTTDFYGAGCQPLAPAMAQASYIANRMRERGILLSTGGPFHNVLKIKPPLVFTEENEDFLVKTLDEIFGKDLAGVNYGNILARLRRGMSYPHQDAHAL